MPGRKSLLLCFVTVNNPAIAMPVITATKSRRYWHRLAVENGHTVMTLYLSLAKSQHGCYFVAMIVRLTSRTPPVMTHYTRMVYEVI
jgi:hypothetical protein